MYVHIPVVVLVVLVDGPIKLLKHLQVFFVAKQNVGFEQILVEAVLVAANARIQMGPYSGPAKEEKKEEE